MLLNSRRLTNCILITVALVLTVTLSACGGADSGPKPTPNDTAKPYVTATYPITNIATAEITEIIKVTFSESIAKVNTDNISITAISSTGILGQPLTFPQQNVLVLTTKDTVLNVRLANAGIDLSPNTQYLVKVQGVQDYAGNVMRDTCQFVFATTGASLTPATDGPCATVTGALGFETTASEINENIPAGTASLVVSRTGGSDGVVTVDYATSNLNATAGSDYTESKGTLTFADGDDASQRIVVPIINDKQTENSEKFVVTLSNTQGGASLAITSHTITINDDDIPVQGRLAFAIDKSNVIENITGGNVTVVVNRTGGSTGSVSVDYATSNGTASNSAIAGKDYTTKTGTLIFAASVTSKTIAIPIINDKDIESIETFSINLSKVTGGATLGSPATHTVSIIDDEQTAGLINLSVIAKLKQLQFNWTTSKPGSIYNLYINPDGASGFKVISSGITNTLFNYDIAVHNLDWMKAKFMVEACIKTTCYSSNELTVTDQMLKTIGYFKASNTGIGHNFGRSVALSDDGLTLAVGAPLESSNKVNAINDSGFPAPADNKNDAIDSGAVYLFKRDKVTGDWNLKAYIKPSNTGAGDQFGIAVALDSNGTTLAVGADLEDSSLTSIKTGSTPTQSTDNNSAIDSGAVYVYILSNSNVWQQQAYIKATNAGAGDNFGHSVSLSNDGNTLAVGAYNEDSLIGDVINSSSLPAPDANETNTTNAGAVYVFSRKSITNTITWSQQSYLKSNALPPAAGDFFGYSVALSGKGSTIVVGAYGKDFSATIPDSGTSFLYTYDGVGSWLFENILIGPVSRKNDNFGWSVTINDNADILAIASRFAISTGGFGSAGEVVIFKLSSTGSWLYESKLGATNAGTNDYFGDSISFSGDGTTLIVGAIGEDGKSNGINSASNNFASNAGAAYLFTRKEPTPTSFIWDFKSYIKASNTDIRDGFGGAVAINYDGSIMAVGAADEEGNTTTVVNKNIIPDTLNKAPRTTKGFGAGAVYLY